jgi:hypothetical protein
MTTTVFNLYFSVYGTVFLCLPLYEMLLFSPNEQVVTLDVVLFEPHSVATVGYVK